MRGGDIPKPISRCILVGCRIIGLALQTPVGMEPQRVSSPTMDIVSTQRDSVADTALYIRPNPIGLLSGKNIAVVGKETETV